MTDQDYFLRSLEESDWPAVLTLANISASRDPVENLAWLKNQKAFTSSGLPFRHYLAVNTLEQAVAYGAIEGSSDGWFRLYLSLGGSLLKAVPADLLFEQLVQDARQLGAQGVWVRLSSIDKALLNYYDMRGFTETRRFPGNAGQEIIILRRQLPDLCYLP